MAHVIQNEKGFKVISCSLGETTKFGGIGICDFCNNASFKGYIVCVLNSWYCEKCYQEWSEEAVYYDEDSMIEQKNYNRYSRILLTT